MERIERKIVINMDTQRVLRVFEKTLRYFVGIVFLYSSIIHLLNPWQFLISLLRYEILDGSLAVLATCLISASLFSLGILFIHGRWSKTVGLLAVVLVAVFVVAQASAMQRGLSIGCGCFGGEEKIGWFSLLRTSLLEAGCLYIYIVAEELEAE